MPGLPDQVLASCPRPDVAPAARCRVLADVVFDRLRAEAITADGLAVWITPQTEQVSQPGSVGPTLYGGTAGLALALARYGRATGKDWAVDLSVCAIRHAVEQAPTVPAKSRLGFHAGWAGIAYAAAAVGVQADDAGARAAADAMVDDLAAVELSGEFDLIGGVAGTVAATALLAPVMGERALQVASRGAAWLARRACPSRLGGRAWRAPGASRRLPLTGLAHGAAGVGWALLELAAVSDAPSDWAHLAQEAFAYESGTIGLDTGGWPDLRHYGSWRAVRALPAPAQVAWCHGAGGIALSRMRALRLGGMTPDLKADAERATQMVVRDVEHALGDGRAGSATAWGLCHGFSGHRSTVATAFAELDPQYGSTLQVVDSALARLPVAETGARDGLPEPGLMTGRAGLGLCLLEAAGISPGSVLLPAPLSTEDSRASVGAGTPWRQRQVAP